MNEIARERLKAALGDRVSFDNQICAAYNHDLGEMPDLLMAQIDPVPQAVVVPGSVQDVATTLTIANTTETPVTPRGQASSGFGGAIPTKGGVVLDLSAMNRIININEQAMTVDVEPGVVWQDLSRALNRYGMDNRICPTSAPSATVGGWFSMGGVGIGSLRFGSVADVVEEIEVVGLDGQSRTYAGQAIQPFYQTCGTLGVITRVRLKCRRAEVLRPFAATFPDAGAAQLFIKRATHDLKPDTIMVHSDGYAEMRAAAGNGHSLPKGHFLAIFAIPEADLDEATVTAVVKGSRGEMLPDAVALEEWEDRFYPMRIKKVGPTVLVGEFYLPQDQFAAVWEKVSSDLRRDTIGMEALAVHDGEMAILLYLPDCSTDLLYPVRMAKAVRPLNIARSHKGRPYTAGLWFAAEAKAVLGEEKYRGYLATKKQLDPKGLLNPGKIVAPRMRWLPLIDLGTLVSFGSKISSPLARLLAYRCNSPLSPVTEHVNEH